MECPECKKPLLVSSVAIKHMETYGNSITVRTICCSELIRMKPLHNFEAFNYTGTTKFDDWGY